MRAQNKGVRGRHRFCTHADSASRPLAANAVTPHTYLQLHFGVLLRAKPHGIPARGLLLLRRAERARWAKPHRVFGFAECLARVGANVTQY